MRPFDFDEFIEPFIDDQYKSRGIMKSGHQVIIYTGNLMARILKQMIDELQEEYPKRIFNLDRQFITYKNDLYVVQDVASVNGKPVKLCNVKRDSIVSIKEIFQDLLNDNDKNLYLQSIFSRIIGLNMNDDDYKIRWDINFAVERN